MLTFPTKPSAHRKGTGSALGTPRRAQPCQCGPQAFEIDGECVRCGHYTQPTIQRTWHERALAIVQQHALAKAQHKTAA